MQLLEALTTYFRGERGIGMALVPVGFALLALAFYLWRTQSGGFMWGLVAPLVVLGLAGAAGGAGLVIRTDAQVAELTAQHAEDPAAMASAEAERMEKVNANWPRLKIVWLVLAAAAFTLLFVVKKDWAVGLGLALLLTSTLGMWIDVFAERRAEPYTQALERARQDP